MEPKLVNVVQAVDNTFLLIFGISALLMLGITAAMIWFVIRYSRKRNPNPATFHGNFWAEVIWIVVPTLLVMGMFYSGWHSYRALRDAPEGAMEVKVTARMWSWDFEYENGKHSGTLVVPVGKPVKLALTSTDVLHGFFAPAFRLKIDTVPGMTTYGWFRADKPGEFVIFCSVYCGLQHAKMLTSIKAVSQEEYDRFLAEKGAGLGHPGKALLDAKGCLSCHSLDGSASIGPSLKDVWGREVVLVSPDKKEKKLKYDAASLKMMIMGPRTGVVKGFDPMMPAYADQITPDELTLILDFLERGDSAADGPEAGRAVADAQGCLGCHSTDGSDIAGPSFKGMFGKKGSATDGAKVDKAYVESVLKDPSGRIGKPSAMPPYPGLSDAERGVLLKFLESLGEAAHAAPAGAPADMPGHGVAAGGGNDKQGKDMKPHTEHK
ncbi:MAG TPA: cytochrome c oxidase subunit II [Humidesulfovibrio sp.]|uniref:cytochrome c oxidase subunit II n=1 Tax=Humidesulfovibrio sp. TaxID=2910988 RepID=UPI002B769680|nr:cytochrome c oxidase subunit II [Humidesulfovibrio sp.]HWR03101.1 cytochrome c oxidase subunit II [Humidesulfovibrio sp.]